MADEFHSGTNWWDSSRNRYDSGGNTGGGSSSSSSGLNSLGGSFSWPADLVDANKGRSSMESGSVSDSSVVFHDTHQKQLQQQGHDSSGADLHMMGLGLSSPAMDWNQALIRGEKGDGGFRSMLQENLNSSANYQQETAIGSSHHHQVQWRGRMFSSGGDSSIHEFKQMSRGFSLDQTQFSPHGSSSTDSTVTCQGLQSSFQMDSSAIYGAPSSAMFPGLLGSENQPHQSSFESRSSSSICYPYAAAAAAGANYGITSNELISPWSKVPPFLRNSPPKQNPHSQLHFSNNAPFWNASASAMTDVRPPSFFPSSLQPQFPTTSFEEKPKKNISEVGDSSTVTKKGGSETAAASKRPRNEAASTLPAAFKVRKEKMGDRITALQQLVSPFGKTDTASVLSEAIEYIKFLHEQVTLLSTPYLKNGAPTIHQQQQQQQQQQSSDKSKDPEGQKQDLRSRGLCLVPVSSTLPVTHETPVDIWTPTFGGTFR